MNFIFFSMNFWSSYFESLIGIFLKIQRKKNEITKTIIFDLQVY